MTPRPIVNNPVRVSEFNASCTVSHDLADDPIVFPGLPGASHLHSFLGNRSTDAHTTLDTLLKNTASSCKPILDSPDHKSHVGPADSKGQCSGKFPVAIPPISFVIGYPTSGSAAGFKLSSGNAGSMHGDAFLAWAPAALGHRVKDCVVQHAKCNTVGTF